MRLAILALLLLSGLASQTVAGETSQAMSATATGKERLSDKGSDEQRINDCKVPVPRRTHERPTDCASDVRS